MRKIAGIGSLAALAAMTASITCAGRGPAPAAPTPAPAVSVAAGPPPPLDGATITVTPTGFVLQGSGVTVQSFRVYQGAKLLFINNDLQPHDIMSDPYHIHTDCPEINVVGFLTPGQSRSTDPLTTIRSCGFHDHDHEGDEAYHGTVNIEAR